MSAKKALVIDERKLPLRRRAFDEMYVALQMAKARIEYLEDQGMAIFPGKGAAMKQIRKALKLAKVSP